MGPYRILRVLGEGTFGRVYLAEDEGLGRQAALKFLKTDRDELALKLFDREAKMLARASKHANIVEIYHYGDHEGQRYFALEYVPTNAQELLRKYEKGLPVDEALRIIQQCAEALEFAHRHEILHRDIKPANILLEEESQGMESDVAVRISGPAKLADFGLAKLYSASSSILEGRTAGTPAYMSPEQAAGEELGPASDIFSLGVTLYQLLCGRCPFEAPTTPQLLQKIMSSRGVPLDHYRPDLTSDVLKIVSRAIGPLPQDRFQSAGEMARSIREARAALRGEPSPSEGKRGKWSKPWLWLGLGTAAGILVAMAILLLRGPVDDVFAPIPAATDTERQQAFGKDTAKQQQLLDEESLSRALRPPSAALTSVRGYEAYQAGFQAMRENLFAEAVKEFEKARQVTRDDAPVLRPLDYLVNRELGAAKISLGSYEEAIELCKTSYNQFQTERALVLIRLAVEKLGSIDEESPLLDASTTNEAQYAPRGRTAGGRVVRVSGEARDDFLIGEVVYNGFRMLPPFLDNRLLLQHYARVPTSQKTLTLTVSDFTDHASNTELTLEGTDETIRERVLGEATGVKWLVPEHLASILFGTPKVCYAQADSTNRSALSGTEVEILSPREGDSVLREEALFEWRVRAPHLLQSVSVNGQSQLEGIGETYSVSGSQWMPLRTGLTTLEVQALSKEDPVESPVTRQITVNRKELPARPSGRTYLASPASHPSVMVLAFEGFDAPIEASSVREPLERSLENALDRRFDVQYLSSIEALLSDDQRSRVLASQESAVDVAKCLAVDFVVCGSVVGYSRDTEVIAKLIDARNGSLVISRAVYIAKDEGLEGRLAELANWLAMALPRIIGLVGETRTVEIPDGTTQTAFVTNISAEEGLLAGQPLSVFRRTDSALQEIGRGRVLLAESPYSLCAMVSRTRTDGDLGEEDNEPRKGDLILIR